MKRMQRMATLGRTMEVLESADLKKHGFMWI